MTSNKEDDDAIKAQESRVRRKAVSQGFRLEKSRNRHPDALGYGGYMLIDVSQNFAVLGGDFYAYSAALDEIEGYLNEGDELAAA